MNATRWFQIVIGVVLLSLNVGCPGGGTPPPPRMTGSISITGGYGATNGEQCSPNTSGIVTFTITPINLTGTKGLDTQQSGTAALPQFASEVGRDIENNTPIYGCQASKTFFNLKPGTWQVTVTGAAGNGSCTKSFAAGQDVTVKIWQGVCQ